MTRLAAGTIKRIHVNRHKIAANRSCGSNLPQATVQTSRGAVPGHRVVIVCTCGQEVAVMDQAAKKLSCGARMYIETKAEVFVTT